MEVSIIRTLRNLWSCRGKRNRPRSLISLTRMKMRRRHNHNRFTRLPKLPIIRISTKISTISNTTTANKTMTTVNSNTSIKTRTTANNSSIKNLLQFRSNKKWLYLHLSPSPPLQKSKIQTTKMIIHTNLLSRRRPSFWCSNKRRRLNLQETLKRRRANLMIRMRKNLMSLMITNLPSNNRHHLLNSPSPRQNKQKGPLTIPTMMKTFHINQQLPNLSLRELKLQLNQRRTRNNSSTAMTRTIDILIAGKFIVR